MAVTVCLDRISNGPRHEKQNGRHRRFCTFEERDNCFIIFRRSSFTFYYSIIVALSRSIVLQIIMCSIIIREKATIRKKLVISCISSYFYFDYVDSINDGVDEVLCEAGGVFISCS